MLTLMMKRREERESGFTLIELLVVVAIIGILAAIAIPVFLNQRSTARNATVESDLRNLATVMETAYTQNKAYPTTTVELTDAGAVSSDGNTIQVFSTASDFVIAGCNAEGQTTYWYDSAGGGFVTANPDAVNLTLADGSCPAGAGSLAVVN